MSFKQFYKEANVESNAFNPAEYIAQNDVANNFITFIGKDTKDLPEMKNPEDKNRLLMFIKAAKDILIKNTHDKEGKHVKALVVSYHFCQRILEREVDENQVLHSIQDYYSKNAESACNMNAREREGIIKSGSNNVVFAYNTNGTMGKVEDDMFKLVTVMDKQGFGAKNPDDIIHKVDTPAPIQPRETKKFDMSKFTRVK
jgi:hypothetical protein